MEIASFISKSNFILDVGAGGISPLKAMGFNTLSLDVVNKYGVNMIGDIAHLPFRDNIFDVVVAVDVLEHIPKNLRSKAIRELRRVSKESIILHVPLENGYEYLGRKCDFIFQKWYKDRFGYEEEGIKEHLIFGELSPKKMMQDGFMVKGTINAHLWLLLKKIQVSLPYIGVIIAWILYFLSKSKQSPPFRGGVCYLRLS
jgi:hypothetical protein